MAQRRHTGCPVYAIGGSSTDNVVLKSSEVFDSSDLVQGVWLTLADDDILPEEIGHGVLCEYVEIVARLFRKGSDSMLQEDNLEADN